MGNLITRYISCEIEDVNGEISNKILNVSLMENGNFILSNIDNSDINPYKTRFIWDGKNVETTTSNEKVYVSIPHNKE